MRTRAWHAAALLRLSHGDRRGASAAVAAGLRALEQHRLTLGATELRAHASGHGEELATLGLRLAVESGSAARVLAAAERRRAAGLLLRPARPPDDEALAAELAELRRVTADLDEALRDGHPDAALARRQARSKRPSAAARCAPPAHELRADARRARRPRDGTAAPRHDARARTRSPGRPGSRAVDSELSRRALGERVLVEFFALDGRLHAVDRRGRAGAAARARRRGGGQPRGGVAALQPAQLSRPRSPARGRPRRWRRRLRDRRRAPRRAAARAAEAPATGRW